MAYRITFKASVSRDLKRLSRAEADRILLRIANDLPERADHLPELKGKFAGLRKFRIGDYRVVFAIIDDSILITRIGHRRDIYKH
ncbi:MAG: type II toxin-antitoxin system RelE/ParE family toxin [Lentisphaeria bacterium]|nr:type II toxin-antitoxin system RelE/ParE family toxin [Lentisphaeria bacterium]